MSLFGFLFLFGSGSQLGAHSAPTPDTAVRACENASIFLVVWMAVRAMCLGPLTRAVSSSANRKARKVHLLVFGEYLSRGPSEPKSLVDCIAMKASFLGPLRNSLCKPFVGYFDVAAAVVGLLFSSGPLAVFRRVIFIVINSLKGVPLWARPHIFFKHKEFVPSGANLNSTASIVSVLASVWVTAPSTHSKPYFMDRRERFAVSFIHAPCLQ